MFRILVAEDDAALNKMICDKLSREGYIVSPAFDGEEALRVMEREHIDLVITDIMMPVLNGYQLLGALRGTGMRVPVMIVTARDQIQDMEKAFSAGTDDYMIKPINLKEMVLRVGALLRRAQLEDSKKLVIGDTVLDYAGLTVSVAGRVQEMPPKEFYLLFKLLSNPNKIFTRLELLDEIWGMDSQSDERNVDAHIKKIRKRFTDDPDFDIVTVRGLGYKAELRDRGQQR